MTTKPDVAAAIEVNKLIRDAEREDLVDRTLAEMQLRSNLNDADFHQGRRALNAHIDSLPPDERARLESGRTADGTLLLNDPATLLALAENAIGPTPTTIDAARTEYAGLKKRMTSRDWYKDDRAQLRFRRLLNAFPELGRE